MCHHSPILEYVLWLKVSTTVCSKYSDLIIYLNILTKIFNCQYIHFRAANILWQLFDDFLEMLHCKYFNPRPLEEGVLRRHKQTSNLTDNGHCGSMTESTQWVDSVKMYILRDGPPKKENMA